jgi:hypothetical protein
MTSGVRMNKIDLATEPQLLERLLQLQGEIVFLVGSAVSSPQQKHSPGVPMGAEMVNLVASELSEAGRRRLLEIVSAAPEKAYQEAFRYLLDVRTQEDANRVIRRAVLAARRALVSGEQLAAALSGQREACDALVDDVEGWHLPHAVEHLGRVLSLYPKSFGRLVLTTNFDPLIEISVRRARGLASTVHLHSDGTIDLDGRVGCAVVHLHGDWCRGDTLHTSGQLESERPRLEASLVNILRAKTVVVLGYGGWKDTFTTALIRAANDDSCRLDLRWAFYGADRQEILERNERLLNALAPGIQRGRVRFYGGVNVHDFFDRLATMLASKGEAEQRPLPFEAMRAAEGMPTDSKLEETIVINAPLPRSLPPPSPSTSLESERLQLKAAAVGRPGLVEILNQLCGHELDGRFRIVRLQEFGSQFSVFEGVRIESGERVAIKVPLVDYTQPHKFGLGELRWAREAARTEWQVTYGLSLACSVFPRPMELLEADSPLLTGRIGAQPEVYLVQEWVTGTNLDQLREKLFRSRDTSQPDRSALVLKIGQAFVAELVRLSDVVYCDVSATNIFFDQDSCTLRLVDAGSVLREGALKWDDAGVVGKHGVLKVPVTLAYLTATEYQDYCRGRQRVATRACMWPALAKVLIELATNRHPVEGVDPELAFFGAELGEPLYWFLGQLLSGKAPERSGRGLYATQG